MVRLMRDTKKQMVEAWNRKHRVGQLVSYVDHKGNLVKTRTTSVAVLAGGNTPVVKLDGIDGCYALDRVTPITSDVINEK